MIIRLKDTARFDRDDFYGQVYVPSEAKKGFNALLVMLDGRHPKKRMVDATRLYYVVKGSGTFTIDDAEQKVAENDLAVIQSGQKYSYQGRMTLLEVNISPTNSFKGELLE